MFRRASLLPTVPRYINTKPHNSSYHKQLKLTQQDARNKWLEDDTLDPVAQDRMWLAATAVGSSPLVGLQQNCISFNRALLGTRALAIKSALSCCLQCATNLSPSVFQNFRQNLYLHYTLQTLSFILILLNGHPQIFFPLNYLQPGPTITEKTQQPQTAASLQNPVATTVSLVWLFWLQAYRFFRSSLYVVCTLFTTSWSYFPCLIDQVPIYPI